jgi:hypothetical protein
MRAVLSVVLASALGCASAPARDSPLGTVTGVVLDADGGRPVERAVVRVVGTRLGAQTDAAGRYRIERVPAAGAGSVFLEVERIGYYRERRELEVRPNAVDTLDFRVRVRPPHLSS